jgi:1-acyl-sn-glycerol-3-phosphate acyltransferase
VRNRRQQRPWQVPSPRAFIAVAWVVRPILRLFTIRRWSGLENIPATGGVIVAVNHLSVVDPLLVADLLYDCGRIPRFMSKSEIFSWPVAGRIMTVTGQIPVNRSSPDAALALRDAVRALQAGECVVIYPEGTLTKAADYWPMAARTGVAKLALLSGAPVVPVAQWGAHRILGRDHRPRLLAGRSRHTISLLVGPAVDLDLGAEGNSMQALSAASARVMAAITGQLEELRGEQAPPAVTA